MAQIKMDVSEYEQMKENTTLLKQALEREKELSNKVEILNKEKIQILKDSDYQVQYITKHKIIQYVLAKRPIAQIVQRFKMLMEDSRNIHYITSEYMDNDFFEVFFEIKELKSYDSTPEIVTKGLDEVKVELREEEKEKLGKEFKEVLKENKKLRNINSKLLTTKKELNICNKEINSQSILLEDLQKDKENKIIQICELEEQITKFKNEILLCLNNNTFFIKDKIRKILNK